RTTTAWSPAGRWRGFGARWPVWVGRAAGAWSLAYGVLGLLWMAGGPGFPFGVGHDPDPGLTTISALAGVRQETGAPVIAACGLLGAVVARLMGRSRGAGPV